MRVEAAIHPTRPDRITLASPYTAKDLIRTLPGARWSKDDSKWSVPLAWTSCLALRDVFGDDLIVMDDLSKWAWELKRTVIDPAITLRESLGEGIPGDERLYPFQRAGVAFLALVRRALLGDEMGSGKTIQTILALKQLDDSGDLDGPVLVVCPNTMKRVWERELRIWWPEASAVVVAGTAEKRRKQIRSGAKVTIVNWEALRTHSRLLSFGAHALRKCSECGGSGTVKQAQCEVHKRELNEIEFAAVVADECHRAKDPNSAQTRALRAASGDAQIRFGLSGTPIANDPTELWPVLNWMDSQEWPAKSAWVTRLINFTYNLWGGMEVNGIKPTHEVEFHSGLDPHMRRLTKRVTLPFLPPIVTERRDVEMSPRQATAYTAMRDLMVARLDAGVLMAANPMVQVGRLMQLATSYGDLRVVKVKVIDKETGRQKIDPLTGEPVYRDEEHLFLTEPSAKLDALMTDLPDFEGQSVVTFAESRQVIELLSERMNKKGIRHGLITGKIAEDVRDRTIEEFQAGAFQHVLCTIKAGGVGITLTKASIVACLQRNWSPVEMSQAIARAHRIGSEEHESITVVDYVTPDSVEEAQIASLASKRNMLEEIVRDKDMMRKFLIHEPLD